MKSIIRMSLGSLLAVVIFVEGYAIAYNNTKNTDKNIHGIGYLNPGPYLKALFYPVEKPKIFFPRIVKNGCGTYAVQIRMRLGAIHSFDHTRNDAADTSYEYMGVYHVERGFNFQQLNSGIIRTTADGAFINSYIEQDKIANLKRDHSDKIFAGDTVYDARIGYELQFSKEEDAYHVMRSYMDKQIKVQFFNDSIDNCHNYKP